MVTDDYTDFEHTGPGTLAGRYMRMFWQPIYRAEDLLPGQRLECGGSESPGLKASSSHHSRTGPDRSCVDQSR